MKATLVGFRSGTTKKDGKPYLTVALMYKDISANGGAWVAERFLDPSMLPMCKAGEVYNIDFDPNGRLIDFELVTK